MTMDQPEPNEAVRRAVVSAIHKHWVLFLVEGIVLVLLGAAAIILPVIATLAFTLLIGWLFLLSGAVGLVTTFWMRQCARVLVVAHFGCDRHRRRHRTDPLADQRHDLAHAGIDRIFHRRGYRHAHVRPRASRATVRPLALDAGKRHRRSHPCRDYFCRPAGNRDLGAGSARWHQPVVRRHGDDRHGARGAKRTVGTSLRGANGSGPRCGRPDDKLRDEAIQSVTAAWIASLRSQ